ncbi:MAG: ABC transporter substrate-binding protein [Clostridia bacterium]
MKRQLCLILVCCLLLPSALAESSTATVGTVTEMSGCFYSDLWGSNAADMDVRALVSGYATIALAQDGSRAVDATVVAAMETALNPNGDQVYRFLLKPGLRWSNGEAITARDYVFTVLLQACPELAALGASGAGYSQLIGYEGFHANSSTPFAGVRLISELSFSLTVRAERLPCYAALSLVRVEPTPISAIAPEAVVTDDGAGAYLHGTFTAEGLAGTLLGESGYLRTVPVSCGPYMLLRYDAGTHTAELQKNPYYQGDCEGRVAQIDRLTFRSVKNAEIPALLQSNEIDLATRVADGAAITQGLALEATGGLRSTSYLRPGLVFLACACEDPTTAQLSVRKALALCLDTDELCASALNGFAQPVYGYYGLGQWMPAQAGEQLSALNLYGCDPMGAKALLITDGWIYNRDAQPFSEGVDEMRYKMQDGRMIPLSLRWAKIAESSATANVEKQLTAAAQTLGAGLVITEMSFSQALAQYYRQTARTCNLFLLGTNFAGDFDPCEVFETDSAAQGVRNATGLLDTELARLAQELRAAPAGDQAAYLERWLAFQRRFSEVLPMIPLYSNVYYDFCGPRLTGYHAGGQGGWSAAILNASVQ